MARVKKAISARKLSILLLLRSKDGSGRARQPLEGLTRLQKLLFLIERRTSEWLQRDESFRFDFDFEAEKYGPADLGIYQDLEFLVGTGLVSERPNRVLVDQEGSRLQVEAPVRDEPAPWQELDEAFLSFEYLMGNETEGSMFASAEQSAIRVFELTDEGEARLRKIRDSIPDSARPKFDRLATVCEEIRTEFGSLPLRNLIQVVYESYPMMTANSEILDEISDRF